MKKEQLTFPSELNSLINRLKFLKYKRDQLDPEKWTRNWVENILAEYEMVLQDIKSSPKISPKDKTNTVNIYRRIQQKLKSMRSFIPGE
jgi:hypothetical protein